MTLLLIYNESSNFSGNTIAEKHFKTIFTMYTKIHCIHCGKEFFYKEATVVQRTDMDEPLVYCKHYPECDGSLIDMMEV